MAPKQKKTKQPRAVKTPSYTFKLRIKIIRIMNQTSSPQVKLTDLQTFSFAEAYSFNIK